MFKHKYNFSQVQCKLPDDGRRPTRRTDIYVYFNVFFKLIKVHFLVSELYINLHIVSLKVLYDSWVIAVDSFFKSPTRRSHFQATNV